MSNRIFVSTRLLKPEEVRDFCDRRQHFMEGATDSGLLTLIDRSGNGGGSAPWTWIFVDVWGVERRAERDGRPSSKMPMLELKEGD